MEMKSIRLWLSLVFIIGLLIGGLGGRWFEHQQGLRAQIVEVAPPERALVKIWGIKEDNLIIETGQNMRFVWEDRSIEAPGLWLVPWSQLPNDTNLLATPFLYTANTKTNKFYPTNSYPARGVKPSQRRYFHTKTAAEDAGFIASKLVK